MTNEEAKMGIENLKFTMAMILFDPQTGEDKAYEMLNGDDRATYDGCVFGIEALEKAEKYRWHDLRKNPEDLPKENPLNNHKNDVLLVVEYANGKHKSEVHIGHLKSKTPYSTKNEKGDDNFWGIPTYDTNWTIWGWSYFYEPKVIAWREIEPFEEE